MLAKKISSLQHPFVLRWTNLVKERAFREETNSVFVSGKKLIKELSNKLQIKALLTVEENINLPAEQHFLVTEGILKKITGVGAPDGYAAEVALPAPQDLSQTRRLLILDRIADPGNLGTLIRSAHALGWDGVVATPGTVDFFNDKALRAAKGASFYLPYGKETPETIASWAHTIAIADIRGTKLTEKTFSEPLALVLSSEAKGPQNWIRGEKICIPMKNGADSLNVASAGAILLYSMRMQ